MSIRNRMLAGTLICLSGIAAAQSPDQLAAERVLGPRWKQTSRVAGLIFAGTVLDVEKHQVFRGAPVPTIEVSFRVDRAIAGVRSGQVLVLREWAGIWPMHRAMHRGQRMLLFFYPPSGLGLTSPVGGPLGQITLDPNGNAADAPANDHLRIMRSRKNAALRQPPVTLSQLERAIRSAREGKE